MGQTVIQPEDYKYYVSNPDPSFSPRKNQAVIQETIKETEEFFKGQGKVLSDNILNRIDILNSYGRYRFNKGVKSFEEYAGRHLIQELIGEKILSKVRVMDSVNKLQNNRKGSILL